MPKGQLKDQNMLFLVEAVFGQLPRHPPPTLPWRQGELSQKSGAPVEGTAAAASESETAAAAAAGAPAAAPTTAAPTTTAPTTAAPTTTPLQKMTSCYKT
jgi:hypothetical protein